MMQNDARTAARASHDFDTQPPPFAYRQVVRGREYVYLRHGGRSIRLPSVDAKDFQEKYAVAMAQMFSGEELPRRVRRAERARSRAHTIPLPDVSVLRDALFYDPETGFLYWRDHPTNKAKNGSRVLSRVNRRGYFSGGFMGETYLAHRIIWKMVHGYDPVTVDHIDGDTSNNRLENLRDASPADQARNTSISVNNTSGASGVCKAKGGKWRAAIGSGDTHVFLGTFDTFAEAVAARKGAERCLGYHQNHGRKPKRNRSTHTGDAND